MFLIRKTLDQKVSWIVYQPIRGNNFKLVSYAKHANCIYNFVCTWKKSTIVMVMLKVMVNYLVANCWMLSMDLQIICNLTIFHVCKAEKKLNFCKVNYKIIDMIFWWLKERLMNMLHKTTCTCAVSQNIFRRLAGYNVNRIKADLKKCL